MLKTQSQVFAPTLLAMLGTQAGPGAAPSGDVSAPLLETTFSLAESTFLVPETAFQVPARYREAPLEDLFEVLKPAQAPPRIPISTAIPPGNGVSNPVPISNDPPKYTEAARRAKIEGSVLLSLVVDVSGATRDIKVVRSLDPGWIKRPSRRFGNGNFKPGQKDGNPVAVQAQMQVTFRLLDKPPQQ